jgi:hypothetical protein
MFLATKAAWAGVVFIFLTTGISRSRPTVLASGANLSREVPVVEHRNDVKRMQQILQGIRILPREGRWRLRSPNLGEHPRVPKG